MIDKKQLAKIHDNLEKYEETRDKVIKQSRDVVKLSKRIIYSIHRDEAKEAEKFKKQIESALKKLNVLAKKYPSLLYSGSMRIAEQEYVEAVCLLELMKTGKLVKPSIKVEDDSYLLGLFDLTGELVRKAINKSIKGKHDDAVKIRNFVSDLYNELMKFDFRANELRRKFDSIKYNLKKLDDLVLELKLKGKVK